MRKLRVWGMTAILGLGLAAHSSAAAGDEEPGKPSRSWFGRMFAGPPEKIDIIEEAVEATTKGAGTEAQPEDNSPAAEMQRHANYFRARDDFFRREKALDRLMEFAMQTGQQDLVKRVEALTERAWKVYQRKSGGQVGPEAIGRVHKNAPGRGGQLP
jgi:hypothetical protein